MIRSALMNVMTAAALKAGRGLKRDFGEVENLQVSVKGPGDFVSAADSKAEKSSTRSWPRRAPAMASSGGIGRDRGPGQEPHLDHRSARRHHQFPAWTADLRRLDRPSREGQLVAGLVYNPATDDMFIAEKGQGAYLNNRRLRVAARRDMGEALIGCGIPHLGKQKAMRAFAPNSTR